VAGSLLVGFGVEMLIVSLLLSASLAGALAVRRGATWDDIQKVTGEKFASVLPVILILLAIGMLIGSWVLSGTIPFLIHWGIRLVDPRFFALTAFLVTGVMSLCTGTSWGSAGTMGVALMGAAAALGAPLPMVAGAVVSGAYLGDKMSPLSDSTNISAIAAGADLFAHIRHMLYTAVPSGLVSLALFTLVGLRSGDGGDIAEASRALAREIDSVLNLGPLVLLPLLAVLVAIARRVPPALALAGSALLALIVGIAYQGFGLASALTVAVRGFDGGMVADLGSDPAALSIGLRRSPAPWTGSWVRCSQRSGRSSA
jgi:NhaC family Na+:H+ antiporter